MEDRHGPSVNFDAIHHIVNRQSAAAKNNMEPATFEQILSPKMHFSKPQSSGKNRGRKAFKIDFSSIFSTADCTVPEDVLAMKDTALKNGDGMEHIHSTLAASDHQDALLQNEGIEKSAHLHLKDQWIDEQVSRQGSGRGNIQSACKAKLSSVDQDLLSLERMDEDMLTMPMVSSYLSHEVEKVIKDIIFETDCAIKESELPEPTKKVLQYESMPKGCKWHLSDLRSQELLLQKTPGVDVDRQNIEATSFADTFDMKCNNANTDIVIFKGHLRTRGAKMKLCSPEQKKERNLRASSISTSGLELLHLEETAKNDQTEDTLNLSQSSQVESGSTRLSKTSCAYGEKDAYNLQVSHKELAREETKNSCTDYNKAQLEETDTKSEHSHHKATEFCHFSLSSVVKSNISPTLQLLRKRSSESHAIAYDVYDPHNASIQQRTLQNSRSSISISQEEIESQKDMKQVEDFNEKGLTISNTSRLPTSADIKSKSKLKRQNEIKSTSPEHQSLEKSGSTTCTHSKQRTKRPLNWEDQECLQVGGSKWISGVRRSTRIRSRPLEFWRGERFLYGRILNCVSSVIGIKYTSPVDAKDSKDKTKSFKVQSYVDEKYTDFVNFSALY